MIQGLVDDVVLKVRAKTGANTESVAWIFAGTVFALIALVFFSIAGYVWFASRYDGAIAGLVVGGVHLVLAAAFITRCLVVRRHTREIAQAKIVAAAKQPGWHIEPAYVAIGLELVKVIGLRNLIPLAAAGIAAAGWSASKGKPARRAR